MLKQFLILNISVSLNPYCYLSIYVCVQLCMVYVSTLGCPIFLKLIFFLQTPPEVIVVALKIRVQRKQAL